MNQYNEVMLKTSMDKTDPEQFHLDNNQFKSNTDDTLQLLQFVFNRSDYQNI